MKRKVRWYAYRITLWLLEKKFDRDAPDYWAWNCTCFPFDIPLWSQIWSGLRLVDGSLSWKRLNAQIESEMQSAMEVHK